MRYVSIQGRTCLRFDPTSKRLRKSGGCKRFKQEIKYKFDSNRLLNVGDHFPGKGAGTDHTFVVCIALYIILSRDYMVSFDWTKSPAV